LKAVTLHEINDSVFGFPHPIFGETVAHPAENLISMVKQAFFWFRGLSI